MYNLWKQIHDYLQPEDTLYFLGDAIDRGPDGIKIMLELLMDSRVIYLKGNHEQMLYDACSGGELAWINAKQQLWFSNGGFSTAEDFLKLSSDMQDYILKKIEDMPVLKHYKSKGLIFDLSHAGFTPKDNGRKVDLLWDRNHIKSKWCENKKFYKHVVIHGHTPVQMIRQAHEPQWNLSILNYCGGHKIDIDLGSFKSKKIALLNLDTMTVKYFYDTEKDTTDGN
jgi:serine/threonine protein phosphatase 1